MRALDDAEMTWHDIDAVVIGTAPDSFEGVMMPELYLADALGAAGKPIMRVHTAGSVGGSTAIVATHLVQSGVRERVLTVAFEKQSEGDTTWGLSGGRSGGVGAGGYFAPHIRAYIERSKAPEYVGWMVAVKDRKNALEEPLRAPQGPRHLPRDGARLADGVGAGAPARVVPGVGRRVRDGADQRGGRRRARRSKPAWVHGTAIRSELGQFPGRDPVNPKGGQDCAADVYAQAGITDPKHEIDAVECYVPFSWYEPMWMENLGLRAAGRGLEDDRGRRDRDGRRAPGERVGRRAVVEPDRRVGDAALRRGCAAGARPRG